MKRTSVMVAGALWIFGFSTGPALADMVGYRLEIAPAGLGREFYVKITNQSVSVDITAFKLEIFHLDYIFDEIGYEVPGTVDSFTLEAPDRTDGEIRSTYVQYTFSGFSPDEVFQFEPDTDKDSEWGWLSALNDYQTFMFNNGSYPNAEVTVGFSSGETLSGTLPDYTTASPHIFSQPQVIPIPSAVWLTASGLLSLISLRPRRRPRA